jgi:hypothetical protein
MPDHALPYVYDVMVPMMHPVRARVGDRLVVRPGHAERPVVVVRYGAAGWYPVRLGPPNYGALIGLEMDGVITARRPASPLAAHPLARSA